jgi:hypothetical protein
MSCIKMRGKTSTPHRHPTDPSRRRAHKRQGHGTSISIISRDTGEQRWWVCDHGNPCEGAGAVLRTYRRIFRGVHKRYLHLYVVTYEAMVNTKRVTPRLIRRMCVAGLSGHIDYT